MSDERPRERIGRATVSGWGDDEGLRARAAVHAALGEAARLAIVEELVTSDRAPGELAERLAIPSNLLAHHLDVLEHAGLIDRSASAGDRRRKYVRLRRTALTGIALTGRAPRGDVLFLCSLNSARSQLAAAMWTVRSGRPGTSAGTRPAARVHRGAVAAARRAGLSLADAAPSPIGPIPPTTQVVTVCDLVHEELEPARDWWHWSIPDPVVASDAAAFDAVVAELDERITAVLRDTTVLRNDRHGSDDRQDRHGSDDRRTQPGHEHPHEGEER